MTTTRDLYKYLDEKFPKTLSCEWDNDGLMCCADPEKAIKRVLVTLDITNEAIEYALSCSFDAIISHHPLIFSGIKALNTNSGVSSRSIALVKADICAMSFHTRLDAAVGGVNDALAERLGLHEVTAFETEGIAMGRIGKLEKPMQTHELAAFIKTRLGAPYANYSGNSGEISTLALLGGSGKDEIAIAASLGADAYLSGELGYHSLTDAVDSGIVLYEAGHYYTEFPVCEKLRAVISDAFPELYIEVIPSINIHTV